MENPIFTSIETIGSTHNVSLKNVQTVASVLKALKLEDRFFAVLLNEKRAKLDDEVKPTDKLTILPKIAGG